MKRYLVARWTKNNAYLIKVEPQMILAGPDYKGIFGLKRDGHRFRSEEHARKIARLLCLEDYDIIGEEIKEEKDKPPELMEAMSKGTPGRPGHELVIDMYVPTPEESAAIDALDTAEEWVGEGRAVWDIKIEIPKMAEMEDAGDDK